jgi:hypothetical protein
VDEVLAGAGQLHGTSDLCEIWTAGR